MERHVGQGEDEEFESADGGWLHQRRGDDVPSFGHGSKPRSGEKSSQDQNKHIFGQERKHGPDLIWTFLFGEKPTPPPPTPILQKTIDAYKLWHSWLEHIPKLSRYTLGVKIDTLFLEIAEEIFSAAYASDKGKAKIITKAGNVLDRLKLLLKIGWEVKVLDEKKYAAISIPLNEIGKMIGGWKKQLKQ